MAAYKEKPYVSFRLIFWMIASHTSLEVLAESTCRLMLLPSIRPTATSMGFLVSTAFQFRSRLGNHESNDRIHLYFSERDNIPVVQSSMAVRFFLH